MSSPYLILACNSLFVPFALCLKINVRQNNGSNGRRNLWHIQIGFVIRVYFKLCLLLFIKSLCHTVYICWLYFCNILGFLYFFVLFWSSKSLFLFLNFLSSAYLTDAPVNWSEFSLSKSNVLQFFVEKWNCFFVVVVSIVCFIFGRWQLSNWVFEKSITISDGVKMILCHFKYGWHTVTKWLTDSSFFSHKKQLSRDHNSVE